MKFFFTPHARTRARERYGLELTPAELGGIIGACETGEAVKVRTSDRGDTFAWTVGGTRLFPVVKNGVIITFLPADFMLVSHRRRWLKERRRTIPRRRASEIECEGDVG